MLLEQPVASPLDAYEPERYWGVWQHPEGRYAYIIGLRREAWLIALDSEEAGRAYLASDAAMNRRASGLHRLDGLTLPDAFAAVRAQALPFVSSQGISVRRVLGVELRTSSTFGTRLVRRIPL